MKYKYIIANIPLILGICCFFTYAIIGSEIPPNGKILELFGLIQAIYFLIFLGIMANLFLFIRSLFKK